MKKLSTLHDFKKKNQLSKEVLKTFICRGHPLKYTDYGNADIQEDDIQEEGPSAQIIILFFELQSQHAQHLLFIANIHSVIPTINPFLPDSPGKTLTLGSQPEAILPLLPSRGVESGATVSSG